MLDILSKTAVSAPAPRPSDEELLAAIGEMPLMELRRFAGKFRMALIRKRVCVRCGAPVRVYDQVGRCVYASPCNHRQYQGQVPPR